MTYMVPQAFDDNGNPTSAYLADETFRKVLYHHGVRGDQSFLEAALQVLDHRVASGRIDESDQLMIRHVLRAVPQSPHALRTVAGSGGKRGAGKRGFKAFNNAIRVALFKSFGKSAEESWAAVAEHTHQSEGTVQKDWTEWKREAEKVLRSALAGAKNTPKVQRQEFADLLERAFKPKRARSKKP